jgi:ABC-2 type transport system ATP-binding protein
MSGGSSAALDCSGVCKRYRDAHALVDLALEIERGEVFGLLGPNGAGKTTFFRLLLGLVKASSGVAALLGEKVPVSAVCLSRMGALLEEPAPFPWMTARRFLSVASDMRKVPVCRAAADSALERVGLGRVGKKHICGFSQGMRQRLGIAQAIMGKPELLILDEPANGLDPEGIEWLRCLIREEAAAGVTILVSCHQLGEIEKVCDRVGILNRGRLIEVGAVAAIGGGAGRVKVVVCRQDADRAAEALCHLAFEVGGQGVFYITGADNAEIGEALAVAGLMPETIVRERPSLEQRFLDIIAGVDL